MRVLLSSSSKITTLHQRNRHSQALTTPSPFTIVLFLLLVLGEATIAAAAAGSKFLFSHKAAFLHPNNNNNNHSLSSTLQHHRRLSLQMSSNCEEDKTKMTSGDEDAKMYNKIVSSAVDITDGYIRNGLLTVTRSSRDIDNNKRRSFLYNIPIPIGSSSSPMIAPPTEIPSNIKARIPSPSGNKIAILLEEQQDEGKTTKQIVEIWTNQGQSLSKRIVIPPNTIHGKISTDKAGYGSIQWNQDENALVYSAEVLPIQTTSFFDSSSTKDSDKEEKVVVVKGGQYTLGVGIGENWGEKYTSTVLLSLFCLDVITGNIGLIENAPSGEDEKGTTTEGGYLLGQPIFTPNGKSVVYTAWDAGSGGKMPKRLGSTYCQQRFSKIYVSSVDKLLQRLSSTESIEKEENKDDEGYTCLTPDDALARSPRFYYGDYEEKTSKFVFLSNTRGFDTHVGCMELQIMDWNDDDMATEAIMKTRRTLVHEVRQPSSTDEGKKTAANISFPGLFLAQLPESCFIDNGKYVVLTTQWGSVTKVITVSTDDGSVTPVNVNLCDNDESKENASQSLICLSNDGKGFILAQSESNSPAVLGYVRTTEIQDSTSRNTQLLAALSPIAASSHSDVFAMQTEKNDDGDEKVSYQIITLNPPHGDVDVPVQCILLLPPKNKKANDNDKIPVIVVPHGGPHSCTSTTYVPSYLYLCQQGRYAILHVNYRGSSGFGQDGIESLPGCCGTLDVKDVVHATETTLESYSSILDSNRVGICGGSHGGYLAGHCTGQYPNLFKVSAMRNPVTNIASMVTATDIMDWCYIETFGVGQYDWSKFRGPKKEELGCMWDASPIAYVENVCAPTLVALGMSDKRVPPSQGLEFYHTLRSRGIKTKLLVYEKDDHAIDGVQSEADHWLNIKLWFDEHL